MLCHIRSCVLVFIAGLLFAFCRVSNSTKPIISPSQKELVINEGDILEIVCTGNASIKFIYPITTETVNTSSVKTIEYEKDGVHTFILQRVTTVFGDTGWYSCADENVEITSNNHDDSEVNWLYVYVKSDRNFFVEYVPFYIIDEYTGEDVVIPCRPTSPDLVINIESENENELINRTSFDPKIGFIIRDVRITDSGEISCIIEKDNYKQVMNYTLLVEKNSVSLPYIDENLHHVTRGEDLRINCTVELHSAVRYLFNWTRIPEMNNSRISTELFIIPTNINKYLITSQMTILNITDEDAGKYECFIRTARQYKKTSIIIALHDPQVKYINLTAQRPELYYQREKGESMQYVVYVDGYPKPIIQWFRPNGIEIGSSEKYTIKLNPNSAVLKINSLQISDTGIYTVEAKNNYVIKKINFTLNVLE